MPSPQRVHVMGVSGSGKTTTAERIAARLDLAHIELDAIHWQPNWRMPGVEEFRDQVGQVLKRDAWVVDGNYRKVRDLIWERTQMVVFLDLPLGVTLGRLLRRTVRRSVRRERLWAGNREDLWTAFCSRDSVIYYAVRTRKRRRREFEWARQDPAHEHIQFHRLGSQAEIDGFIVNV